MKSIARRRAHGWTQTFSRTFDRTHSTASVSSLYRRRNSPKRASRCGTRMPRRYSSRTRSLLSASLVVMIPMAMCCGRTSGSNPTQHKDSKWVSCVNSARVTSILQCVPMRCPRRHLGRLIRLWSHDGRTETSAVRGNAPLYPHGIAPSHSLLHRDRTGSFVLRPWAEVHHHVSARLFRISISTNPCLLTNSLLCRRHI